MVGSAPRRVPVAVAVALLLAAGSALAEDEPPKQPEATGGDRGPKLAGTKAQKGTDVDVVSTREDEEGMKTYEFGAVEVEGRLRSPQIIYFLRRVRAQFATRGLGHRSFLRELSDTRRHPSFK